MNINKTNVDKIWEIANLINNDRINNTLSQEKFEENMAIKYDYLYSNFPNLFSMCCSSHSNLNRLKFMLDNIIKIQSKDMTEHDASVKVGEQLVNDFVKPDLEKNKKGKKNKK